ncbi:MAG TPA: TonB-dependent receptor [Oligoflexia bacterium]|nr:TonB-dependent receptor [Oligoflexia bacterium]HMR24506.1 TonB-dependent receptor [Oligoflexia bacterium]
MHFTYTSLKYFIVACVCLCLFTDAGYATGLSKSVNVGPKAIGMGGAFVGIADDATAIYHNPAGITQLDGHHFYIGADSLLAKSDFTPEGDSTESAKKELLPVPSFSFVSSIAKPLYVGVGVFFPHGNGGKFPSDSAVISHPNEGKIYSMEIIPTVAYKSDFGLSIGAGFRIVRIQNELKGQFVDLDPNNPGTVIDTIESLDVNGWAMGASFGVFYKPIKQFSVGANLRSIVEKGIDGTIKTTSGGPINGLTGSTNNDVSINQTLPMTLNAGFGFYPTDKLTLGLAYQFEKNDAIKEYTVDINDGALSQTFAQNWENTHTIHVGADYKATDALSVRAGYAKDFNDAIPDEVINRIIADIAAHEISAGAAYQLKNLNIGLTWNGRFGERDTTAAGNNPVDGNYKAFIHSISLGLGYKI